MPSDLVEKSLTTRPETEEPSAFSNQIQSNTPRVIGTPFVKGDPRAGRPKGRKNNLTIQQRQVAEMVLGKPGTAEFDMFVKSQREQLLAGTLPPPIIVLWLNYLIGKPIERVEVKDTTPEFEGITAEQLRERARLVAHRVFDVVGTSDKPIDGELAADDESVN